MRRFAMARLCGVVATLLVAWLNGPGTPMIAHADTNIDGGVQLINEGGVQMKVETDAIGAPPPPSEFLLYAQRPGVVFPKWVAGCEISSPTSVYCPPNPLIDAATTTSTCTDGCSYCWQQGYRSCTDRDPVDQGCAGNGQSHPAYVKAAWTPEAGTYVEDWLEWSDGCQSNWSLGQMDGDVGIMIAMTYGVQPQWDQGQAISYDPNTLYDTDQGGSQGYSNMLWGGAGSACTTALAEPPSASADNTQWRHTHCIGN